MNHTKEPWYGEYNISDEEGPLDEPEFSGEILADFDDCGITPVICHGVSEVNAKRIVACVNACAGITNEALEKGLIGCAVENLAANLPFEDGNFYFDDVKVWEDV